MKPKQKRLWARQQAKEKAEALAETAANPAAESQPTPKTKKPKKKKSWFKKSVRILRSEDRKL